MPEVIRQKAWTEEELRESGFQHYEPKKQIIMARPLSDEEAPKVITTSSGEILIAKKGYFICYRPGVEVRPKLEDYSHWPVEGTIFARTYLPWDQTNWDANPAERDLMRRGCQPFYKVEGVWAKQLEDEAYLQSMEHDEPVLVESGQMVLIGVDGEPYKIDRKKFKQRYEKSRALNKYHMGKLEDIMRMFHSDTE